MSRIAPRRGEPPYCRPVTNVSAKPLAGVQSDEAPQGRRWLQAGYWLIAVLLLFRWGYLASGVIELSNDEAYQWLWSKHLALSYFSKPLGIAFIQFAGTSLWGDTQLGVRFFSPLFAALLSVAILRFMAAEAGARAAFLLLLVLSSAPLMGVGTILMTIDPPLALCWTLAMLAGWRAVQPGGQTSQWLLAGLAAGLGFLCKYSSAYLVVCWALYFVLWPPARAHLRRPGPWLALLILGLCTLPVVIWNAQHDWITARHVATDAGLGSKWHPTLRYLWEFLFTELALLNPIWFVGACWAMVACWKRRRQDPLGLYLLLMGWTVFLGHVAYSLHSRIQPNWIAPAVVPMFCLMVIYWERRWREGVRAVKAWLIGGLALGLAVMIPLHDTDMIGAVVGRPLPGDMDPLRRVRGYQATADYVESARQKLLQEGKPAFIICDHYGLTGLFSFYLPPAHAALGGNPLVYCVSSPEPGNQLYFWPEYRYAERRKGQNAIYVTEPGSVRMAPGWIWRWLAGKEERFAHIPPPVMVPPVLLAEFDTVTDLGVHEVRVKGRIMKRVQLFECRGLK
jgi:Dolichyl-phosphate-mannose-protein mannosyltransferase